MEKYIYAFDEEKHLHTLNGEPLFGTTTVLGVIDKPQLVQWAADLAAANALEYGELAPGILAEYEKAQAIPDTYQRRKAREIIDKKYPQYKKARTAHKKKKEKAADWGTVVHKAIEVWIKTATVPEVIDIRNEQITILPEHRTAIDHFLSWAISNQVTFLESEKGIYSVEWWTGGIVDFVCEIKGKLYIGDIKTSSDIYETYWLQTAAYAKMLKEMGLYKYFDGMVIINCKKDGTVNVKERFQIDANIECFDAALKLHKRFKKD